MGHESRITNHVFGRLAAVLLITAAVLVLPAQGAVIYKRGTLVIIQDKARVTLNVEVADTLESRAQGLMYRTKLDENAGMLFDLGSSERWPFWMKNTLIPLSIAFISVEWQIVDILDMAVAADPQNGPFPFYAPGTPARYALEVNQGFFKRKGIAVGAKVVFTVK